MARPSDKRIAEKVVARFREKKREAMKWLTRLEWGDADPEGAEDSLRFELKSLATFLAAGLEILGLPDSRLEVIESLRSLEDSKTSVWKWEPEHEVAWSPQLELLEMLLEPAYLLSESTAETVDRGALERLESMLRDTGALVYRRNQAPAREADIQEVMHDYLSVVFPDFVKKPDIPGALKHFEPDGGVPSLRTAIEFKFSDSPEELRTALSGVFEDMSGYSCSRDWIRFFSVFYLTHPFETQARIVSDFTRPEAPAWVPLTVVGTGARKPRRTPRQKKAGASKAS